MASRELTVGIDIGTTSVKAVAADADGTVVARARVVHPIEIPAPDRFQHDADLAWRRNVLEALAEIRALVDDDGAIRAVNVASMVPSLTAVDAGGVPVGPGVLYGDGRGRVPDSDDPQAFMRHGESTQFLRWLHDACPGAAGFWPAVAVANAAIAGGGLERGVIGRGGIAPMFPLFDFATGGWNAAVLDDIGVSEAQLPRFSAEPSGPVGRVAGMPETLIGPGTVDATGEQIVSGAVDAGDVLVICGTTLITWGVLDAQAQAPGLWTIPHTTPDRFLVGGPSNAGGLFINWALQALAPSPDGVLPDHPDRVPVWMPYIRGERTPLHDPDRRSEILGLDLSHGPAAMRRAVFEAAGFVVRHHLDLGATAGLVPRRLVATGGGTRVGDWVQALADCTGVPVDVVAVAEGGALGAAFGARIAAGLESSEADGARWARTSHRVEPDPAWRSACADRYAVFRRAAGGPDAPAV
jgi:sugar (pentulose or hexulose) kinase